MIKGAHIMFYSSKANAARKYLKEKLNFKAQDIGGGWLIFKVPEANMGCHPADEHSPSGTHNVSFYCENIQVAVKKMKGKGVKFIDKIEDHGYGFVTHFYLPGKIKIQLYQPKYKLK